MRQSANVRIGFARGAWFAGHALSAKQDFAALSSRGRTASRRATFRPAAPVTRIRSLLGTAATGPRLARELFGVPASRMHGTPNFEALP